MNAGDDKICIWVNELIDQINAELIESRKVVPVKSRAAKAALARPTLAHITPEKLKAIPKDDLAKILLYMETKSRTWRQMADECFHGAGAEAAKKALNEYTGVIEILRKITPNL